MELGVIGLGKMGLNIAINLKEQNHIVKGFDISQEARDEAKNHGIETFASVDELVAALGEKNIWVMLPSGEITENMITHLCDTLPQGAIVMDGGNSNYKDTLRRAKSLSEKGLNYLDVGTSGGISGARAGACLMIGGEKAIFDKCESLFRDLTTTDGYLYAGKSGSGHFLKMVHNGIEYGMMQAIGEGFHILKDSEFDYDLEKVAKVWNNGSVIRSWLIELAENLFRESPDLSEYRDIVAANGEGLWTVQTALELNVPAPVIALSVMVRSTSQQEEVFSNKVLAGLRNQFGGHSFVSK